MASKLVTKAVLELRFVLVLLSASAVLVRQSSGAQDYALSPNLLAEPHPSRGLHPVHLSFPAPPSHCRALSGVLVPSPCPSANIAYHHGSDRMAKRRPPTRGFAKRRKISRVYHHFHTYMKLAPRFERWACDGMTIFFL